MASYIEMDFDQLVTDAIEDSIRTAAELRAETTFQPDEQAVVAYLQCEEDESFHGEKSDLPEKSRFDCSALMEPGCNTLQCNEEHPSPLTEVTAEILKGRPEPFADDLIRLVESSEYVFNGFEELLQGSSSLLGGIEKLIRSSKASLREFTTEETNNKTIERRGNRDGESSGADESPGELSPMVSLTALQKASDLENERIRVLQNQIQAMNESIRETDVFIKQCQKINEDLTEECRKLDECTQENFPQHFQASQRQIGGTVVKPAQDTADGPAMENGTPEIGNYQTSDPTAPNYDRWSLLYNSQAEQNSLPYNVESLNLGDGEPHRYQYYVSPPYEELESIWESGEEEEEEKN